MSLSQTDRDTKLLIEINMICIYFTRSFIHNTVHIS
jgi:hypothetical protein